MNFHHILRIYIPEYAFEDRLSDVLKYCKRTGCSEVLLFTSSYDMEPSFKSIKSIKTYTNTILKPAATALRNAGITVSVNVMQTLGHVYFPDAMSEEFSFRRRVNKEGAHSRAGACPLCSELREWVAKSYSIYSELKPHVLFIDDDFRTVMDGLSCFCQAHLEKMSLRQGRELSRDEVVSALFSSNYPSSELRKLYFEVTTEGFSELAALIRESVKSISPETRIGIMTASWPGGSAGIYWEKVLASLAGNEKPIVRPQIGLYSEGSPKDFSIHFLNPDRFRSILPEWVEFWPEIENYPFTGYSKSARTTNLQIFSQIMNGFNHHAMDLFDFFDQSFSEHENLIETFEKRKEFYHALCELIPEGNRPHGVKLCAHKDALLVRRSNDDWFGGRGLASYIPNLGMPMTHSGNSKWQILCGDDVLAFSDVELETVLSKGALIDATAAEALGLRGQSERIGVIIGDYIPSDQLGYEEFVWPKSNNNGQGKRFPLRLFLGNTPDWRKIIPCNSSSLVASKIRNFRQEEVTASMILTENQAGERFAILGFSQQTSRRFMENSLRANQLRQALGWIARSPVPVATSITTPYLWPILNRSKEGKWILGIINLSSDRIDSIPLFLGNSLSSENIEYLTPTGNLEPLTASISKHDGDESTLVIPIVVEPMEYAAFVMDDIPLNQKPPAKPLRVNLRG